MKLLLICVLFAATVGAHGSEFTRHTVWAEGSPFAPNFSTQYEYRFRSGITLRAGWAVGTLTVRHDSWFNVIPEYKKETFYAIPVSVGYCSNILGDEHFIEPSISLLCITYPTQFLQTDYYENDGVQFAPGLLVSWRYEPKESHIALKVTGGGYFDVGYPQNNTTLTPWLGLGVGWRL